MTRRFLHFVPEDFSVEATGNSYCLSIVAAWQRLGYVVTTAPTGWRGLLVGLKHRKKTTGVLNWVENYLVGVDDRLTLRGLAAYLRCLLKYRVLCGRLIQVRHNHFPHVASGRSARLAKMIVDVAERLVFDRVAVHSTHVATRGRFYVPHPLYLGDPPAARPEPALQALFFGRIQPYKNLEGLMEHWPSTVPLLIAGLQGDDAYFRRLQTGTHGKPIHFVHGPLSDESARELVSQCAAVIVPHGGPDMIVSGSMYFALTCGVPCVAVGLEHARSLQDDGMPGVIYLETLEQLAMLDLEALRRMDRSTIRREAELRFGTEAVVSALQDLIDANRASMARPREAVC